MNSTEYLRFVERPTYRGDVVAPVMVRVLQQWWESEKMISNPPGEWRDVPLLPDDNTPPSDWPV